MKVNFLIPKELEDYVKLQIQVGNYTNIEDYFLALLHQDCQRKTAQAKLKELLQEGLNSEGESVTSEYWQNLRMSILKT